MRTAVPQLLWRMSLLSGGTFPSTITEKENLAKIKDKGYFVLDQIANVTIKHKVQSLSLIFLESNSLLMPKTIP